MIPSNTGSIQVWCPDITDMSFEELVKAKPDLSVLQFFETHAYQKIITMFKRLKRC